MLETGSVAPDFELVGVEGSEVSTYRLSEFTDGDNWVLLSFYAFDFNPVCTQGACALRDAEFLQFEDDLAVLAISGDGVYSHEQFADQHHINYPLLSDTGRDVGEEYGAVTAETEGMRRIHRRAVFLVDDDRQIRLATTVDAESPSEIDAEPLLETIRDVRA